MPQQTRSQTESEMVKAMFLELSQADLKAIGRSRGFDPETSASQELMRHLFLSDQGLASAMASLTPVEVAGLHLLHCLRADVDLQFFKRVYPELVSANLYGSYNERFKGLFQQVKRQLIQRGLLLYSDSDYINRGDTILERRRFCFPQDFGALLPAPFQPRPLDPTMKGLHRTEILRDKVAELLRLTSEEPGQPGKGKSGRWRLENGELFFGAGSGRFRVEQLLGWQQSQWAAAIGGGKKAQPEALPPVTLLLYALSRLREHEWLAPEELLPLWKTGRPEDPLPEPKAVCEAGYEWGCIQKLELNGATLYRLPISSDSEANTPLDLFLQADDPQHVSVRLDRTPLAALERLGEISRLEFTKTGLRATPNLLKLSHAPAETLSDPIVSWLREHHSGFRSVLEKIVERSGKLIVHENVLVARVSDLALKVMLEKRFRAPGQLVALSREFIAFPSGLLPELQTWMRKSGHVIKVIESGEPNAAAQGGLEDE